VIPPELETDAIFCPNPFNKEMYISFNLENKLNLDYELVTLDGKLLIEGTFESVQREARPLPLPSFPLTNGIYILKITGNDIDFIQKVVYIE